MPRKMEWNQVGCNVLYRGCLVVIFDEKSPRDRGYILIYQYQGGGQKPYINCPN